MTHSAARKGKRKAVFVDVVVELSGNGQLEAAAIDYVSQLGRELPLSPLEQGQASTSSAWQRIAPGRVDYKRVSAALKELWTTEESYSRKILNFQKHFASKLRQYATNPATMIISGSQAQGLFINLEELVQTSIAFEADLRDLVTELEANPEAMPAHFGDMLLHHVRQMYPFKKWLASYDFARMLYDSLTTGKTKNVQFFKFVERMQVSFRESARTTAGFSELLAEPFQRIARYQMMIDPIIRSLPQDSPDAEPLQTASQLLNEICSMQVDTATKSAAIWWALNEHIEGIPATYVKEGRLFIDALDVDEHVQDDEPFALRCSLLLFSDSLMVIKRNSSEGLQQTCQLDDIEALVKSWKMSQLATASNVLGTPRKKHKSMSFKGIASLPSTSFVDFGASLFGLELRDGLVGSSDKWTGRTQRYYQCEDPALQVAFLERLSDAQARIRDPPEAEHAIGRKSVISSPDEEVWAFWSMKDRRSWEALPMAKRAAFALHIDTARPSALARELTFGDGTTGTRTVVRADLQNPTSCLFSVRSIRRSGNMAAEPLPLERLAEATVQVSASTSFSTFAPPSFQSRPRSNSRSRPRSAIFSAAFEKFTGSSSTNLRRGESTNSKASGLNSPGSLPSTPGRGSRSTPVSPNWSKSPRSMLPSPVQPPQAAGKNNSPVWFNRLHSKSSSALNAQPSPLASGMDTEESDAVEVLASERKPRPTSGLSRSTYTRPSRRRSSSQPPPASALRREPSVTSGFELAPIEPLFSSSASHVSAMSQSVYSGDLERGASRRRMLGPRAPSAQGQASQNAYTVRSDGSSTGRRASSSQFDDSAEEAEDVIVFDLSRDEPLPVDTTPAVEADDQFEDLLETMMTETESIIDRPESPVREAPPIGIKRPLAEPSPRGSPAKRQSGVYTPPLRDESPVAAAARSARRLPSGAPLSANRHVSNGSTIRESDTARDLSLSSPVRKQDLFDPSPARDAASALDRLRAYVDDLSETIIRTAEEKENSATQSKDDFERSSPASAARLARSPVRTDLARIGSLAGARQRTKSSIVSPGRGPSTMPEVDTAQLIRWLGTLRAMIDRIDTPVSQSLPVQDDTRERELARQVDEQQRRIAELEAQMLTRDEEVTLAHDTIANLRKAHDTLRSMLISTNEAYLADTEQLFEELRTTDLSDSSTSLLKQLQTSVVAERRARVALSEAEREFQLERSDLESAIERKDNRLRQLEAQIAKAATG